MENEVYLSGYPNPKLVYTYLNNLNSDYINNFYIGNNFSLIFTQKNKIELLSMPKFEILLSKTFPKINYGTIIDNEKILLFHSSIPILYNENLEKITIFKRPLNLNKDNLQTSFSISDNLIVLCTSNGMVIQWDLRTNENPIELSFSGHPNLTSITNDENSIIISTNNGKLFTLDTRNLKKKISTIDLSLQFQFNCNIEHINRRKYNPWQLSFNIFNGPSVIFDLMNNSIESLIKVPKYDNLFKYISQKPIFINNQICFGYSWSNDLIIYPSIISKINLPQPPISTFFNEYWDGIFILTQNGDIFNVY